MAKQAPAHMEIKKVAIKLNVGGRPAGGSIGARSGRNTVRACIASQKQSNEIPNTKPKYVGIINAFAQGGRACLALWRAANSRFIFSVFMVSSIAWSAE
jgi:hypothetical protein